MKKMGKKERTETKDFSPVLEIADFELEQVAGGTGEDIPSYQSPNSSSEERRH